MIVVSVVITVMVMITIVVVSPSPIILLFVRRQPLELAMRVTMSLSGPLVVVDNFIAVPNVIVRVIRVVGPIVMVISAGETCERRGQRSGQQQRTHAMRTTTHVFLLSDKPKFGGLVAKRVLLGLTQFHCVKRSTNLYKWTEEMMQA
jgi:hypothetical protein